MSEDDWVCGYCGGADDICPWCNFDGFMADQRRKAGEKLEG